MEGVNYKIAYTMHQIETPGFTFSKIAPTIKFKETRSAPALTTSVENVYTPDFKRKMMVTIASQKDTNVLASREPITCRETLLTRLRVCVGYFENIGQRLDYASQLIISCEGRIDSRFKFEVSRMLKEEGGAEKVQRLTTIMTGYLKDGRNVELEITKNGIDVILTGICAPMNWLKISALLGCMRFLSPDRILEVGSISAACLEFADKEIAHLPVGDMLGIYSEGGYAIRFAVMVDVPMMFYNPMQNGPASFIANDLISSTVWTQIRSHIPDKYLKHLGPVRTLTDSFALDQVKLDAIRKLSEELKGVKA